MSLKSIKRTLQVYPEVLFLLFFELFQKLSLFGIQAVTFLFLKHEMEYELHNALGIYHLYVGISYMVPVIGAIIADLYVNKVVTILLISFLALVGNVLLVTASAAVSGAAYSTLPYILDHSRKFALWGLTLRALGDGGVRAIMQTIGDDQFARGREAVPMSQGSARNAYYQMLYYVIAFSTIVGICVPPVLRMNTRCYELLYCYPIAFAVPAISLIVGYVVLLGGSYFLYKDRPGTNRIFDFANYFRVYITNKILQVLKKEPIDYPDDADDILFDMLIIRHALALYIPLPIFWALFEQMGSRWVYQATRMNGGMYVEPDQMPALNPIIILVVIPASEYFMYPLLKKAKCATVLKPRVRMYIGCLLAILAWMTATLVEYKNEPSHAIVPHAKEAELWFISLVLNPVETNITTSIIGHEFAVVGPMDMVRKSKIKLRGKMPFTYTVFWGDEKCLDQQMSEDSFYNLTAVEQRVVVITQSPWYSVPHFLDGLTYELAECASRTGPIIDVVFKSTDKCDLQLPKLGIVYYTSRPSPNRGDRLREDHNYPDSYVMNIVDAFNPTVNFTHFADPNHNNIDFFHVYPSTYIVKGAKYLNVSYKYDDLTLKDDFTIEVRKGGVYIVYYILDHFPPYVTNLTTVALPNAVSMWFQLPQYILMSTAQYYFPMTLLQYSFTQVPATLRHVLIICWLVTIALGNFIVIIFSFPNTFYRELNSYVLYTLLIILNAMIMCIVLYNYLPVLKETFPEFGEDDVTDEEVSDEEVSEEEEEESA